jgi:ankyrin repeat protein
MCERAADIKRATPSTRYELIGRDKEAVLRFLDFSSGQLRGSSVLHAAAHIDSVECVRLLLEAGAAKEAAYALGFTPLHIATSKGHVECVAWLLRAGADKEAEFGPGWRPLHVAASHGREELVRLLLRAGASIDAQDDEGLSALHHAVFLGSAECAEALLRAGANKEAGDAMGRTPLHTASSDAHAECARLLLRAGADPTARARSDPNDNVSDRFPADLARDEEMRRLLLRAQLVAQLTPLAAAAARGELFDARLFDPALWRAVARYSLNCVPREQPRSTGVFTPGVRRLTSHD